MKNEALDIVIKGFFFRKLHFYIESYLLVLYLLVLHYFFDDLCIFLKIKRLVTSHFLKINRGEF